MTGKLYLVATPIGNLEDITLRAIRILQEVDIIAAEDTRHTLKLLNHLQISKPLMSYHRHNEETKTEQLLLKLKEGKNIALVSDAGTPGISDPGEEMVKEAIKEEIKIIPIPGACAAINALIVSGLDTKEFCFFGFLPLHKKLRKEKLEQIRTNQQTILLYEAPHKLTATLKDLEKVLGERQVVIAKEITKIYESYTRGTITQILSQMGEPKGEHVIIIEQAKKEQNQEKSWLDISINQHYEIYEKQGWEKKEIIKQIAKDRGVVKNEIYQQCIEVKKEKT